MSAGDIDAVTKQLQQTTVDAEGVLTFAKEGLKLDTADDAKKIIDALNSKKCVKSLVLDGNTMGVEAAKAIGHALEKHPEFQNALWSDMFTGRLKSEIPEALQYLGDGVMKAGAHLCELDLSDNAFGPNGMKGLITFLQSESCYSLQILRLHNNGLGTTGGKMLAESLLECHKRSVAAGRPLALRVFQSGRGRLENVGATALAEPFKAMGSLEEVIMPQNGIYHGGISALADAFAENKNLRHINLQDNTFTEKGAQSMAKCLRCLENLEVINFGDCLLKTEGAKILAKALKAGHSKLKVLNLQFNEINHKGAVAVTEAMCNKENLESLQLDGNCLGTEGIESVRDIMTKAGRLDLLAPLSEDDGTENEEDEDDDLIEVTDEEEPEDTVEGEGVDDPHLTVQGVAVTPRSDKPATVSEFLQSPTAAGLHRLGPKRAQLFVEHLGNSIEDVEVCTQTVIKTCSVVTANNNKAKDEACECADAIFSKAFSIDENRISSLTNAILVHLGLIKSEDKKFKPLPNVAGVLLVLHHIVQQKYFPKTAKDILGFFFSKPHSQFEKCRDQKHQLLIVLNQ